jgi:hypothetical protein
VPKFNEEDYNFFLTIPTIGMTVALLTMRCGAPMQ